MGYASYQVVGGWLDGQWAGYGHIGICGHPGCTTLVWRGTDAMCGLNPHGGDEDSCGMFFCDGHLDYTTVGQRCETCADAIRNDPDQIEGRCAAAGHPTTVKAKFGVGWNCECGEAGSDRYDPGGESAGV